MKRASVAAGSRVTDLVYAGIALVAAVVGGSGCAGLKLQRYRELAATEARFMRRSSRPTPWLFALALASTKPYRTGSRLVPWYENEAFPGAMTAARPARSIEA